MADVVIRAQATQAAPAGYTVPPAQEIVVKSVRAVVDGTGAAAAFLPVLQLIAPGGSVVWEAPASTTIAAGGSADVSWFPRVGGGSAVQLGGHGASLKQTVAVPASVPDGFVYTGAGHQLQFDLVLYDTDGYYNAANPSRLTIPVGLDGVYLLRGEVGYGETATGDYGLAMVPNASLGGLAPHWIAEQQQGSTGQFHAVLNVCSIQPLSAGDFVELYTAQKSGAARVVDNTASFLEAILLNIPPPWVTGT